MSSFFRKIDQLVIFSAYLFVFMFTQYLRRHNFMSLFNGIFMSHHIWRIQEAGV